MIITFNVNIVENNKGNVDLTVSRKLSNYPPMKILNLPKDYIGSMLQNYYKLVEEGKQ